MKSRTANLSSRKAQPRATGSRGVPPEAPATAIETLSAFVAGTGLSDIPADVRDRARNILGDSVGCILAGSTAPEVRRLVALQPPQRPGGASALGTRASLPPPLAAYVNGTAGTWHDLDEGNLSTRTHAAIQIVPAALAECEARGHSGAALIEALVLAYEASARLWRATEARLPVHPHGTYGPLAAALALGRLRGDGAEAIARAANIAMTLGIAASRRTLNDGATVRNVYSGISGRHAFEALDLRDAGFSGEADAAASILGNIYGSCFDPTKATAELGRTWWIRRNYFKRFPSGRYTHGALDLAEEALRRLGRRLAAGNIERIDITTYFLAATMGQQSVRTAFGVRFSIPMLVAAHIVQGPMPLTDDGERAFADRGVQALASRIFVSEDKALTALYPDWQPTRLTVTLRDGTTETFASERILGESDHPLAEAALADKFRRLASAAWTRGADTAWNELMNVERCADIGALLKTWRKLASKP